jgi:hypothetical protein
MREQIGKTSVVSQFGNHFLDLPLWQEIDCGNQEKNEKRE